MTYLIGVAMDYASDHSQPVESCHVTSAIQALLFIPFQAGPDLHIAPPLVHSWPEFPLAVSDSAGIAGRGRIPSFLKALHVQPRVVYHH